MLVPVTSITQASDCASFVIRDITGDYDATDNVGGWGTPNPETTDIATVTLTITNDLYATSVEYDISTDISSLFTSTGLTITSDELDCGDYFDNGYYSIKITYTINGTEYSYTNYQAFMCKAICCVKRKVLELNYPHCDPALNNDISMMWLYLTQAYWAACCGHINDFNKAIRLVQDLCDGCGGTADTNGSSSVSGCC